MYKWFSYFMLHSPTLSLDTHLTKLPSLDLNALEQASGEAVYLLAFRVWAEQVGTESRALHM